MYCCQCGKEIAPSSRFCSFCGFKQPEFTEPNNKLIDNLTVEPLNSGKQPTKKDLLHEQTHVQLPRKEREAMSFGIMAGIIYLIMYIIFNVLLNDGELDPVFLNVFVILTILVRLISVSWIIGIARRLKRNKLGWALFAILSPVPAMIIIGNLTYSRATIRALLKR